MLNFPFDEKFTLFETRGEIALQDYNARHLNKFLKAYVHYHLEEFFKQFIMETLDDFLKEFLGICGAFFGRISG